MDKILIISDSHGLTNELNELKRRYPNLSILHCGDSELYLDDPALKHMQVVKGNCDFDGRMAYEKTIEINNINLFMTHGHLYQVGSNLTTLSYRASEENAQIICYGHTHMARADKINGQLFINPGSIHSPRDRKEKTYAILAFEDLTNIQVNFYTLDGKMINDLSFKTSLD